MTLPAVQQNTQETTDGQSLLPCPQQKILLWIGFCPSQSIIQFDMKIKTNFILPSRMSGYLSEMTALFAQKSRQVLKSKSVKNTKSGSPNKGGFSRALLRTCVPRRNYPILLLFHNFLTRFYLNDFR